MSNSDYSDQKTNIGTKPHALHEGEIEAQRRFGVEGQWSEFSLSAMFSATISKGLAGYIEELPFFFISTANNQGECDCSFRGREFDISGNPYLLLKVIDATTLVFPDYHGNNLFNSLGNIFVNPHIGMLFVDFERRARVRINGAAEIIEDASMYANIWPLAQRYLRVTPSQVYGNCKARIPKMVLVPPSDSFFQDE